MLAHAYSSTHFPLSGLANVLVFYNTIRTMGPAFSTPSAVNTEKSESFLAKSMSPVDVAPPVAAQLAQAKAFPVPRNFGPSPKSSVETLSGESTRQLLPPRPVHLRSESSSSSDSSTTLASINRPITEASKLNQMLSVEKPRPRLNLSAADAQQHSLPAPRREGRSPVVRHPTLSIVASPQRSAALSAVPLKTPMETTDSSYASHRSSFINMYASRSAAPTGSSSASDYENMPSFRSPGYSSADESDVPRSAFEQKTNRSLRSEVRNRIEQPESSDSASLSSLAWATLVANAATSNGGVRADSFPEDKKVRRRSKSLGSLAVPSTLPPSIGSPARVPNDMSRARSVQQSSVQGPQGNGVSRWDSKATFHQGPSRTPKYNAVGQPTERV